MFSFFLNFHALHLMTLLTLQKHSPASRPSRPSNGPGPGTQARPQNRRQPGPFDRLSARETPIRPGSCGEVVEQEADAKKAEQQREETIGRIR